MNPKVNLLILFACIIALLSEWSKPGRLAFGFPFIGDIQSTVVQVPEATKAIEERVNEIDTSPPEAIAPDIPDTCPSEAPVTFSDIAIASLLAQGIEGKLRSYVEGYLSAPNCKEGEHFVYQSGTTSIRIKYGINDEVVEAIANGSIITES